MSEQTETTSRLRHLHVIRELGSGRHGTVHLARVDEPVFGLEPDTEVAIKFLRSELSSDPKWLERFRREHAIGSRIRHPNVVRIWGLIETTILGLPVACLVMDFVEGRTLRALLDAQGAPVEALIRRVGAEAGRGLAALHARSIVHRDIKPENLYLTVEGMTKVMDLGFAQRRSAQSSARTSSASIAGSLAYTAPECISGRAASAASDLYGLGVTLYELATGRHPFAAAAGDADLMIEQQRELVPLAPSILRPRLSPLLDRIVLDLLEKDPAARPRNAELVARIFEQGEDAPWWRRHERVDPVLRSERRLRASRRPTPTAFVGRRSERRALDDALRHARSGQGCMIHLHGPEGSGKRRLIDDFVASALSVGRGAVYFAGEPATHSEDVPLSPVGAHLIEFYSRDEDLARVGTLDDDARINALELLQMRLRTQAGLDATGARALARFVVPGPGETAGLPVAAAAQAIAAMATPGRPAILRIHNAQRLKARTLDVLERAVATSGRLLVILCTHDEAKVPDFGATVEELRLGALSADEARRFVRALFRDRKEADIANDFLLQNIAPIPGLILDSLALLAQRGDLARSHDGYHGLDTAATLPVEGRLATFLLAAWERLGDDQRMLLEVAAVLGTRFRASDLAALLGEEELRVLERLSAMRDAWVLGDRSSLRFRRRSGRKLIMSRIPRARRRSLHRDAARRLQARGGSKLEIAMHWSRAGEHERALPLLLELAERFVRRDSHERARMLLRRADVHLRLLPVTGATDAQRIARIALETRLLLSIGKPAAAKARLEAGHAIAERHGDSVALATLGLYEARLARDTGHIDAALALLHTSLPRLGAGDFELEGRLFLAELETLAGSLRTGMRIARQVRRELRDAGESGSALYARATMELARFEAGRLVVADAERHYNEAERILTALDDAPSLARLALRRARLELDLGHNATVREELETLDLPTPREVARAGQLIGLSLHQEGDFEAALAAYESALDIALEAGGSGLAIRSAALETRCELGRARLGEAEAILEASAELSLPRQRLHALRLRARLLRQHGLTSRALETIEACLAAYRRSSLEVTMAIELLLERARCLEAAGHDAAAAWRLGRHRLERLARRIDGRGERRAFLVATPGRRELTE